MIHLFHYLERIATATEAPVVDNDSALLRQIQAVEKRLQEADTRMLRIALANRKQLAAIWDYLHANNYLLNLYYSLLRLYREVAALEVIDQKRNAVNQWCADVQADPIDQGQLLSSLTLVADPELSVDDIRKAVETATAPIDNNIRNVDKKVEEKQQALFRLLTKILSPSVKDRVFYGDEPSSEA